MRIPSSLPEQNSGSTVYNPLTLYLYDIFVLWFSNTFAWKCSTSYVLLPLFRSVLGRCHLDVGVGSGYFPARSLSDPAARACEELTLVDLNPTALHSAERRIRSAINGSPSGTAPRIDCLVADATQPLPLDLQHRVFDSISIFYLLHCLPGPPERKHAVFSALRPHLAPDGTLVGATILGASTPMNWLSRVLMTLWNSRGVFGNWDDTAEGFATGLRASFEDVEVWNVGRVMLFRARRPRN